MSYYDDVLIRLGVDKKAFDKDLSWAFTRFEKFSLGVMSAVRNPLNAVKVLGQELGRGVSAIGGVMGKFGLGLGALGTAAAGREIVEYASRLQDLSENLGISADQLQKWQYAAAQGGVGAETAASGLEKLSMKMSEAADPTSKSALFFEALGISLKKSNGEEKTAIEIAYELSDAIKNASSSTERLAIAREAFGKSGGKFVGMLANGSDGLKEFAAAAEKSSSVVSNENVKRLEALGQFFENVYRSALGGGASALGWVDKKLSYIGARMEGKSVEEATAYANRFQTQATADAEAEKQKATLQDSIKTLEKKKEYEKKLEEYRLDGLNDEQKLNELQKERQKLDMEILRIKDNDALRYAKLIELAKLDHEIAQQKLKVEEKATREKEKQNQIQEKRKQLEQDLADKIKDRDRLEREHREKFMDNARFTFEDILKASPVRGNRFLNYNIAAANRADWLNKFAMHASAWGRSDIASSAMAQANAIKSTMGLLKSDERNPWQDQVDATNNVKKEIEKIVERLNNLDKED